MLGFVAFGLVTWNLPVAVNASLGLLVTVLPAVLERNYRFTVDVGLVLWITVAMFLHAFGMVPLPWFQFGTL